LKALGVPSFSPQALANVEEEVRTLAHSLIDQFYDKGECDFITDYALQVPIITFMRLAGLPLEDREMLLKLVEIQIRGTDVAERQAAQIVLQDYAERIGRERIADPSGNDMVSQLCRGDGKGNFATDEEIVGYVLLLLGAGLDTVSSSMGFMMRFLAENPGHRSQVLENPRLIRNAIEEMLRRFGVSAPARVLTRNTIFHDVEMREGDAERDHALEHDWPEQQRHCCFVVKPIAQQPDQQEACGGQQVHPSNSQYLCERHACRIGEVRQPGKPGSESTFLESDGLRHTAEARLVRTFAQATTGGPRTAA
jgi:hypothetical protein